MLHINDLTYRIEGRVILEKATAAIPAGHKVGFVGRNGAGKSTLLRLIQGEIGADDGSITIPKNARIGGVAQEAPGTQHSLLDTVLMADKERTDLLAEAETATDPHRIAEIQTRLVDIDAHTGPARAAAILAGLGFDDDAQRRACAEFSGGWRMRVALAAVLFTRPDILLLDEPTNYLDLEGVIWLETYLKTYPYTVLLVSHDRDLLNRAVGSILHLEFQRLTLYSGTYDQFEAQRRARYEQQLALKKKQEAARRHIEAFVERFRYKESKARQAQSRLKVLAKMQPIAAMVEGGLPPFTFPDPEPLSPPIITMEEAITGYDETPILRGLTLRIDNDDRIALLGQNGNGKSTFAKLISARLKVLAGRLRRSPTLRIGYFAQHQLDELNPRETPYDMFERLLPDATEAQRRARLGAIGFGVEKADTKIGDLSGGEKARIMLALAVWEKPHLLILDEPTNHLDVDSREALIQALNTYQGAVILISHDRHLVEACVDRLWLVADGTVTPYDGDLDEYRAWLLSQNSGGGKRKEADDTPKGPTRQDQRRAAAEKRAQLSPLKKAAGDWEKKVETLSAKLAKIEAKLADPALYTDDPDKAQKLGIERGQLEKDKASAEEHWLEALEAYETAQAEMEAVE